MRPGLVAIWIAVAAVGTLIAWFTSSYDRRVPPVVAFLATLVGAALGSIAAYAVEGTTPSGAAGAVIGGGAALAAVVVTRRSAKAHDGGSRR